MKGIITHCVHTALLASLLCLCDTLAMAQATAFNYQGHLSDGGNAANGIYDLQFRLFDAVVTGNQVSTTLVREDTMVTGGVFSVTLDFGAAAFPGSNRWLEIGVRPGVSAGAFTTLSPLQPITATPYAVQSLNATNAAAATNATLLGGVAANQYVLTDDARMTDARIPLPNGVNYIQNTASPQASSNFNISGNGTTGGTLSGNAVNATTQYNIGGTRLLGIGSSSTLLGVGAGQVNTGDFNSFFGTNAGQANIGGAGNSFFGTFAGQNNTTAVNNALFGFDAGLNNTSGNSNAIFGSFAGQNNKTGGNNDFFGTGAGFSNTTGGANSFFGDSAGHQNTTANFNSFFGYQAGYANTGVNNAFFGGATGQNNTVGFNNSFFGRAAGFSNTGGTANSFFGDSAGLSNTTGNSNAFFGELAGSSNTASNNSFFGSASGSSNTTGDRNAFFGQAAGQGNTEGGGNSFFGWHAGVLNSTGGNNSFFGFNAGANNTSDYNSFFGTAAGFSNTSGASNAFFGPGAGGNNRTGTGNTFVGYSSGGSNIGENNNTFVGFSANGAAGITNATAIGAGAQVTRSNSMVLGNNVNVGIGSSAPIAKLDVRGDVFVGLADPPDIASIPGNNLYIANDGGDVHNSFRLDGYLDRLYISARSGETSNAGTEIRFRTSPAAGGDPDRVVIDQGGNLSVLSGCISAANIPCSSDARLKQNITPLSYGLREVLRLRPVRWQWKDPTTKQLNLGLIAQEVEPVMPELVLRGADDREPLGLNYMGLIPLLIRGMQEQQSLLEEQRKQIDQQQSHSNEQRAAIEALQKLVCLDHPREDVCK